MLWAKIHMLNDSNIKWSGGRYHDKQEGFLPCQTPTSTVRLKVEGCRVKNGGCDIKSEEWREMSF